MIECDFSYRHYEECIRLAKARSYQFYCFREHGEELEEKSIFMRHDVDHCLDLAVKMAKFESEAGIKSTYFVRVHAKNYNALSLESSRKLRSIIGLGHEIGLHYEPSYGEAMHIEQLHALNHDIRVLENSVGHHVVGLSPHEPSRDGSLTISAELLHEAELEYQAYDDRFFKDMKYISDSSCNWREGCMHEFIVGGFKKMCILTHPFWWYDKTPLENY